MTKASWWSILFLVVALPLSAQDRETQAESAGIRLGTPPPGGQAGPTQCTLSLFPNPASNFQSFSFMVAYTPCLSVPQTETFTFKWPSTLAPDFTEVTVRTKVFTTSMGCVAFSFENSLVPAALAIKGTFKATVAVRDTGTNALICTASAPMTIP